jgi:hypothetical protein
MAVPVIRGTAALTCHGKFFVHVEIHILQFSFIALHSLHSFDIEHMIRFDNTFVN